MLKFQIYSVIFAILSCYFLGSEYEDWSAFVYRSIITLVYIGMNAANFLYAFDQTKIVPRVIWKILLPISILYLLNSMFIDFIRSRSSETSMTEDLVISVIIILIFFPSFYMIHKLGKGPRLSEESDPLDINEVTK